MSPNSSAGSEYLENLKRVIADFSHSRKDLVARRKVASEEVRVHIDERLEINSQSLKTLNRALELAGKELP